MHRIITLFLSFLLSSGLYAQSGPVFNCPASPDVYIDEAGNFTVPNLTAGLSANGVTFSQLPAAGTVKTYNHDDVFYNPGLLNVVITATNGQGATSSCTVKLVIKDNIPPKFVHISATATVAPGRCVATLGFVQSEQTDNSGSAYRISPNNGFAINLEKNKTTYSFTAIISDPFGNTTTQEVPVSIRNAFQLYPPYSNLFVDWAPNVAVSCGGTTDPAQTGMTTAYATNGCTPEVTYTDVSTKGSHPTTPDYYNYTIKRTWTVTPLFGDPVSQEQVITVTTGTPPQIGDITASKTTLWPANHQMHDIALNYTVSGGCGAVTTKVTVSSNEPVNGTGDGDTAPDWEVVNNKLVRLRAERSGNGKGRYYTITVTATDMAGKTASQTIVVEVPKNMADQKEANNKQAPAVQVQATPNPSAQQFVLSVNSSNKKDKITLHISNAMGRLMEVRTVSSGQTVQIGANYQHGIYYVEAVQGKEKTSVKLVKQSR